MPQDWYSPSGPEEMSAMEHAAFIAVANAVLESTHDLDRALRAGFEAAGKVKRQESGEEENAMSDVTKANWDAKYVNDLPDIAFAVIKSGGTKDKDGRTVPRSNRMLPHHSSGVKSATDDDSVDLPHLRNALARVAQPGTDLSAAERKKAKSHLDAHAKALKVGQKELGYRGIADRFYEEVPTEKVAYADGQGTFDAPVYSILDVFPGWVLLSKRNDATGIFKLTYTVDGSDEVAFDWPGIGEVKIEYTPKSLRSFKATADGPWMWVGITGSSFKDRDGEIIPNASLDAAIAIADTTGDHGPLRIYHQKGTNVGRCLVSARSGNFLVEAGEWDDTDMATKARQWVEEHPEEAGVSIGFTYREGQKRAGVYTGPIEIRERSLLSLKDAACPWTALMNVGEEGDGMANAREKLAVIIGDEMAATVVKEAEDRTETLAGEGVAFKAADAESADAAAVENATAEPEAGDPPATSEESAVTPAPVAEAQPGVLVFDETAIKAIAGAMIEGVGMLLKPLADQVTSLTGQLEALGSATKALTDADLGGRLSVLDQRLADLSRTDAEKIKDQLSGLPRATVKAFASQAAADVTKVENPDAEQKALKEAAEADKQAGGRKSHGIFSNVPSLAEQSAAILAQRGR